MSIRSALVLVLSSLALFLPASGGRAAAPPVSGTQSVRGTHWVVRTSEGFDALCALNVLSGDSFYVAEYPAEAKEFAAPRYAAARHEAVTLKRILKEEHGHIVSAFLTLVCSGGPDSTLDAVLAGARRDAALERAFRASPYWDTDEWALWEQARPHVVRALVAMRTAGFRRDWAAHLRSGPGGRTRMLQAQLARFDVLGEQARLVGHPLQEGRIEVVLLWYSRPHGIRIQGSRFLTNADYPVEIVLRNAAHEPLHPPYDARDPAVAAAVERLSRDPLVTGIVRAHDPSFGYTTAAGYIEEDVVQALEQLVSERLGFADPAAVRWRENDDGMHLLAAAIHRLATSSGFALRGGRFDRWFADAVAAGELDGAALPRGAALVVGDSLVAHWQARAR